MASIINDPLYQAISGVLDTISYQHVKYEDLFGNVTIVIDDFSSVLTNNFDHRKVKNIWNDLQTCMLVQV